MNLSLENKIAGVLVPVFALRTEDDLGIGDLEGLRQFIDWAREIGFKLVQLLPINETGGDNSPYNAISSTAIEPLTLHLAPGSPEHLSAEDFERASAKFNFGRLRAGSVKYRKVRELKYALLEKAFARFRQTEASKPFERFCAQEKAWLDEYAFFRALMEANGGSEAWDQWPGAQRTVAQARSWLDEQSLEKQEHFREREMFFRYVQWIAYDQWIAAKSYADARGVALMGDIPFGVSYYSADVFSRPNEFKLEWSGGAPPEPYFKDDEFTQKWGQNWGIPLYRWEAMRENGFEWWRQRVHGVRRIFHVFRIDHVLGFYRIYSFPWRPQRNAEFLPMSQEEMLQETGGRAPQFAPRDDESWENAEANRREGEEYLRMALEAAGETRLVGEDLGTVPRYVRPSLHSLGIAGFKIPQWETQGDGRVVSGQDYERLSVTTYATHDHKPVRALWEEAVEKPGETSEQARGELEKIAQFASIHSLGEKPDFDRDFYSPALRALFRSNAWVAIVMITDLLARKDRFNVPGIATDSNWSRRLPMTMERMRVSHAVKRRMKVVRALLEDSAR